MRTADVTGPRATLEFVRAQLDLAWGFFSEVVAPYLTDAVCLYEPTERCWNVRPRSPDDDSWVADWEVPEPSDVSTSMGWNLWHLGMFLTIVHDGTFGSASARRADVFWSGSAADALSWVRHSFDEWCDGLETFTDADLDRIGVVDTRGLHDSAEHPFASRTLGWVLGWVNFEVISMVRAMGHAHDFHARVGAE